jgi:hypothetical protein
VYADCIAFRLALMVRTSSVRCVCCDPKIDSALMVYPPFQSRNTVNPAGGSGGFGFGAWCAQHKPYLMALYSHSTR